MKRAAWLLTLALLLVCWPVSARPSAYQSSNVSQGTHRGGGWQGFSPTWIAGVQVWLDTNSGVTTGATESWADKISGYTVNQSTGSKQPTVNASDAAYNGHKTLSFLRTSSQLLVGPALTVAQPSTLVAVGNTDNAATQEAFVDFITNEMVIYQTATPKASQYAGTVHASASALRAGANILIGSFGGTASNLYLNSSTAETGAAGAQSGTGGLSVGATNGNASFLNGKIAAVIVCSTADAGGQLWRLLAYLANEFAIPISL